MCYVLSDKFDLSYGYFTTKVEHIDANGVNAVQITYKPSKKGNYKLYVWENNNVHVSCKDITKKSGTYGFGISADHEVSKSVGVFGRLSFKDPTVATLDKSDDLEIKPTLSWDAGVQIAGSTWARNIDTVGFAIGQMYGSSDYKDINSNYKNVAETEFELYYRFGINKHLGITPAVQYFINPKGGNAEYSHDVFVVGIRTRFDF